MSLMHSLRSQSGSALVALVLALVIGAGAAVGLTFGLVSLGSQSSQVTKPLVSYNSH